MAVGDFNGDGNADVFLAGPAGTGKVSIMYGLSHGDGTFTLGYAAGLTGLATPKAMAVGDCNGS
jgi:hypothetical protein